MAQSLAGQFEQLALVPGAAAGPGQAPEPAVDASLFPRPVSPEDGEAPPPFDAYSCKPNFRTEV